MRGAIIGFGVIASTGHTPALLRMDDHQIVAVVDPVAARRRAAREMIPGVRTFADHLELLAADLALDFVDIAAPPCHHLELALAAARGGLHVLVEKPVATSTDQARSLLRAARDHRVTIFPCHNYKHAPVVREMARIIRSGGIGEVRSATLTTLRTGHARGTPEWRPDWRRQSEIAGGGVAMDHGSHICYLAFQFFGGAAPLSASARTYQLVPGYDGEDNLCCTLTFEGGFALVHLSWTAGVRKVLYSLQGSRGAMVVDEDQVQIAAGDELQRRTINSTFEDASHAAWFPPLFDQFAQEVSRGTFVTPELIEAYWCVATIEAIDRSAARGGAEVAVDAELSFLEQ